MKSVTWKLHFILTIIGTYFRFLILIFLLQVTVIIILVGTCVRKWFFFFLVHICVNHMCNVTMYLAEGRTRTRDCSLGVTRQQVPHQCCGLLHNYRYALYQVFQVLQKSHCVKNQKITWLRKKNIICICIGRVR